jgi:TusA-related sulfurtransferase
MLGLDCTQLRCPEFTVPAYRLIKKHKEAGKEIVVKTLEARAPKRIQHLCLVHEWTLLAVAEHDGMFFIKIKC